MTESTITPTTMTIGIDLGDRKSHICVLDAVGEIAEESRIATTPKAVLSKNSAASVRPQSQTN